MILQVKSFFPGSLSSSVDRVNKEHREYHLCLVKEPAPDEAPVPNETEPVSTTGFEGLPFRQYSCCLIKDVRICGPSERARSYNSSAAALI